MTPGYRRFVQGFAGPDHPCRELHVRHIEPVTHLSQHFPPPRQRLTQQATAGVI